MRNLRKFEVHPGNQPGERTVYARGTNGTLYRLQGRTADAILLRMDAQPPHLRLYDRLYLRLRDRARAFRRLFQVRG